MKRYQHTKAPAKRSARRGKSAKPKKPAAAARTLHHPLYGDIPLVERSISGLDGKTQRYFDCDPDYRPPLPPRAVRGDVRRQVFCSMCHTPKYFYVDESKSCIQCQKKFTFSAKEQKYWYESLQFNFHSHAVRCAACRRQRRSQKALGRELMAAAAAAEAYPKDPLALLAHAQALASHFEILGSGNIDAAIGLCREAYRLSPQTYECVFWEALCQGLRGRRQRAHSLYREFIEIAKGNKRCGSLLRRAAQALDNVA